MDSFEINRLKGEAFFNRICPPKRGKTDTPTLDTRTPIQRDVDKYISEGGEHTKLFVTDFDDMLKDMGY